MYALEAQLAAIPAEGMPARWARHEAMAGVLAKWVAGAEARTAHALGILAAEGRRSEIVSAVTLPDYIKGPELVPVVSAKDYTLGEGYGSLRERTVRVGRMGDHTAEGLSNILAVVDEARKEVRSKK